MTDFRALCAELAEYVSLLDEPPHGLVIRARALLDQPESIEDRIAKADVAIEAGMERIRKIAAAPARDLTQPELERPTDEELTLTYAYAVAAAVGNKRGPFKSEDAEAAQLAGLRAVLARWGTPANNTSQEDYDQ